NSGAQAWQCSAEFDRTPMKIDSMPDRVDRGRDDLPESVMLGLRKYTEADLANFKGFPENDAALANVANEPLGVADRALALLQEIVDGHNPKPLDNMNIGYALTLNPERLGPLAAAMAKRFVELNDPGVRNIPNRDAQWYTLRIAIPALP